MIGNNNIDKKYKNNPIKEIYTNDTFTKDKIGKMVLMELTNGTMVKGKLLEVGKFDISLQVHPDIGIKGFGTGMDITGWIPIIILKSAIAIIWVITNE